MTENQAPGTAGGAEAPGGMPFYEQSRAELKEMLTKRRELAKKLVSFLSVCRSIQGPFSHPTKVSPGPTCATNTD